MKTSNAELSTTPAPRNSPWGPVQIATARADGMWAVSTAGHGGIALSPNRWDELQKAMPGFQGYAPAGWLEEDLDASLAVLLWPESFSAQAVYYAVETVANWKAGYLMPAKEWLRADTGRRVREIAAGFKQSIADCYERGSMSSSGQGWTVYLRHVTSGKQLVALFPDYPAKQFYTHDELPRPMQKLAS